MSMGTTGTTDAKVGIDTLDDLRAHLQTALEIEHATIPPYFTAWLSIKEDANREAGQIVRSVMLEEMLHLTLAANLLNAVGGSPNLTRKGFIPRYPHRLPHCARIFDVSLENFSPASLETFLKIEKPEPSDAEPEPGQYRTIGQFYGAIAQGITYLCERFGEPEVFAGLEDNQVRPEDYYGSGNLVVVTSLASALIAVDEIKEQGEGANQSVFDLDHVILGDGTGREPAHYFRFKELQLGRRYVPGDTLRSGPTGSKIEVDFDAVYPIEANAKISDYERGSEIRGALVEFCESYRKLMVTLEQAFTGSRNQLIESTARMFELKNQGLALMRTPVAPGATKTVGLTFTQD